MTLMASTLRLREHRERLGLTQAEVAERLVQMAWARERVHVGVNPDMVSKWERGLKRPSKLYQRLLCLTFDASPHDLGLVLGGAGRNDDTDHEGLLAIPGALPRTAPRFRAGAVNKDVVAHVGAMFTALAAMDNAVGPRLAVGAAAHQAAVLERLSTTANGRVQKDLQAAASRFAELTGWLHQDLGDLEQARQWSERAMDLAVVHGDRRLVAYVLMRRSTIAAERGDASAARSFAEAAVSHRDRTSPNLAAVSLRAAAVAYSLSGESTACARALGDAQELLQAADPAKGDDLAPYCTPAYLAMEAGGCWLALSQPRKAIASLETGIERWPAGQGRDRSLALSRLASAYAEVGDIDLACDTAEQARDLVVVTGSARAVATLTSLGTRLAPHSRQERVANLRRSLAAL